MPDDDEVVLDEELDEVVLEAVLDDDLDDEALEVVPFVDEEFVDEVVVEVLADVDESEADADDEPLPRGRKKGDDDEEDDDELDPDDVEADLQSILEDRIAASDDEEDDEELEVEVRAGPETLDGVAPKRANEFMCNGCFLLVSTAQFGKAGHLRCPVGEEDCPAMTELFGPRSRQRPAAKKPR